MLWHASGKRVAAGTGEMEKAVSGAMKGKESNRLERIHTKKSI